MQPGSTIHPSHVACPRDFHGAVGVLRHFAQGLQSRELYLYENS